MEQNFIGGDSYSINILTSHDVPSKQVCRRASSSRRQRHDDCLIGSYALRLHGWNLFPSHHRTHKPPTYSSSHSLDGPSSFPFTCWNESDLFSKIVSPAAAVQEAVGNTSALVHESFDGIMVVKSLGRSEQEIQRIRESAEQIRTHRISVGRLRAIFEPAIFALPNIGVIFLLMIGTWLVDEGSLSIGELVSTIALFGILAFPMRIAGIFLKNYLDLWLL